MNIHSVKTFFYVIAAGSRRQSNAYRGDMESTYSLQGAFIGPRDRDSPRPSQRRNDRTPLYLNEESRATMETPEHEHEITDSVTDLVEKRPLAVVRPHHLRSIASSDEYSRFMNLDGSLRESRSLDPFPCLLRKRNESVKFPESMKKKSSRSLNDTRVSFISMDPNVTDNGGRTGQVNNKYANNNCNGLIGIDDVNCPLLARQTSLTTADSDDHAALLTKKWHSCEAVKLEEKNGTASHPKGNFKTLLRNVAAFLRQSSNTSSRQVNQIPNVRDVPVFSETQTNTQNESVV